MKITTVKLTFKGNETINETYIITLKNIKDHLVFLGGKPDALEKARLELKDMLAIVENQQSKLYGCKLSEAENV